MNTNELRIGNFINSKDFDNGFKVIKINYITETSIGFGNGNFAPSDSKIHFFQPIELTEEWLLKAKFIKNQNVFWISLSNIKAELHIEQYRNDFVFIVRNDFSELVLDTMKYVHQLQNLYFALTGSELVFSTEP